MSFRLNQRHSLSLHVGSHERAVGIIVFQEWDQCGCRRYHLGGGNVHVVNIGRVGKDRLAVTTALTGQDEFFGEGAVVVQYSIGLGNLDMQFVISCQVFNGIGDATVNNLTVRGLDEPERVDAPVRCHGTDEPNIWAFWGFNWAHTAVVDG